VLFAGCYVALSGVCAVNVLLLQATQLKAQEASTPAGKGRTLRVIVGQPAFVAAAMSAAIGYGVMILVMTATPLAMVGSGFAFTDTAFVIQWHVLGMYAPGFFTGRLIERLGVERIISAGILLVAITMGANLSGLALENFWVGLVAVGVGWNFMYIGGTALLTQTYRPEERGKVQALNEFMVFATVTTASLSSGLLFSLFGWHTVNVVIAIPLLLILAVLSRSMLQRRYTTSLVAK